MATVAELLVKIGANVSDFEKKIGSVQDKTEKLGEKFTSAGKNMTKFVTGPILAVGGAFIGLTKKVANNADEIAKSSRSVGLSAEDYQKLRFASEQAGVSQGTFERSVGAVNSMLGDAMQGNEKAIKSFEGLGVSIRDVDGNFKDTNAVFIDAIEQLSGIENESVRASKASEIFGDRAGRELASLMEGGAEGIALASAKLEEYGIISQQDAETAEQFNDNLHDFQTAIGGVFQEMATKLLPILTDLIPLVQDKVIPAMREFADRVKSLIDWFMDLSPEMQKFIGIALAVVTAIGPILIVIGKLFTGFSSIISIVKIMTPIIAGISLPMLAVIAVIVALIAIGVLLWKNWDTVKEKARNIFNSVGTFFQNFADKTKKIFQGIVDKIVSVFNGIRSGIKNSINSIIDIINSGINSLNRFGFSIPSKIAGIPIPVIGGASLNINIPRIPRLADGGVVTRETLAIVGERGPEAVIPLDQMGGMGGITIHVEQLVVREDGDIERIAEKLFRLQENKLRGKGRGGRI